MRSRWQALIGLTLLTAVAALGCHDDASAQDERPHLPDPFLEQFDTKELKVPVQELRRGGPPKDGIPAITDPDTVALRQASFLNPDDRVIGVEFGGQARAYPLRMLNWHEIINDTLGGIPIGILYCPLCDSASVIDRQFDDEVLEFGVSGLLYNSNVVLYDRTYDGLWSQIGFRAISGPMAGRPMKHLPFELTTYDDWSRRHPDSTVATFSTGYNRNYGSNPYENYFHHDRLMFPVSGEEDTRLPRKELVMGISFADAARAYPLAEVAQAPNGRVEDTLAGNRIVLQATGDDRIRIVESPESARSVHTFWFSWAAFHPGTTVYRHQDAGE